MALRTVGHRGPQVPMRGSSRVFRGRVVPLILVGVGGLAALAFAPLLGAVALLGAALSFAAWRGVGILARRHAQALLAAALERQRGERARIEERLRLSEARRAAVLEASHDAILVLEDGVRVQECNAAARRMFGCDGRRCVHHLVTDLLPGALPHDAALSRPSGATFETTARRLDGSRLTVEVSIAPIRDPVVHGLSVASVRDVTDRKHWEHSLEVLSLKDELTGLYNRRGFLMFASHQMKLAARLGHDVALVSAGLDGLDHIHEAFGRANGDRAIVELAVALRRSFRDTDVIGRLGDDAFVVLTIESEEEGAAHAVERLAMRIAGRNGRGDLPWTLGASIGWLRTDPAGGVGLGELLSRADQRMVDEQRRSPGPPCPRAPSLMQGPGHSAPDTGPRAVPASASAAARPEADAPQAV
jgi:diguanylate cyclase (GGDEF)-like protein/PAS domain S-box-containing protein